MSRCSLFLICIASFVAGCNSNGRPKLKFERETINVGDFRSGSTYEGDIVLKNVGTGMLLIGDVTTDCSCTVADITQKEIRPGDSVSVKYKVSPHTMGYFQQQIIIKNNTDSSNPVLFVIRGKTI
jgi:hypothetical protein